MEVGGKDPVEEVIEFSIFFRKHSTRKRIANCHHPRAIFSGCSGSLGAGIVDCESSGHRDAKESGFS